jgi:uncharacterized zinc-type alcohol dehydrogenase-like protein
MPRGSAHCTLVSVAGTGPAPLLTVPPVPGEVRESDTFVQSASLFSVVTLPALPPIAGQPKVRGETMNRSAWVAQAAGRPLVRESLDLGPLAAEEAEIAVEHCGLCHSDLAILHDRWGVSQYPAVLGHEITGKVSAVGPGAKGLQVGQRVGVGWISGSCMHCRQCLSGRHQLCPNARLTIVGHRGGFATHVRAHWAWVVPLPDRLIAEDAGPLLCAGVTVYAPLARFGSPTHRVGVLGIGGLGHLAIQFAAAFGCEVTALTSSAGKLEEARRFGASYAVSTADAAAMKALAGRFDLLISTVNVTLNWAELIRTLAPEGRLHLVGAVLEPIPVAAFSLILGQRSISGSLSGSPVEVATMLDFAARHRIAPQTEHYPMSRVEQAFTRLESGQARYRIVLDSDF